MRYGIFADVHSNLEALEAVIGAYKKESIDKYLCVGDVVGYAANPSECVSRIKMLRAVTVAGNHDWAGVDLLSVDCFNEFARKAIFWTKEKLDNQDRYFLQSLKPVYQNEDLTLVHGTLDHPQDFNYMTNSGSACETFRILENSVCFIGHSHTPGVFIEDQNERIIYQEGEAFAIQKDRRYIVNVGSVGQPRDGDPRAAYCIYDTENREIFIKRAGYDIETTREKIIASGLPRFLGDRLLAGR